MNQAHSYTYTDITRLLSYHREDLGGFVLFFKYIKQGYELSSKYRPLLESAHIPLIRLREGGLILCSYYKRVLKQFQELF